MSLIVTLYVPEGLVIAGDSRLTLTWTTKTDNTEQLHSVTASDANTKIFTINDKFGIDQLPQLLIDFFGKISGNPKTYFYTMGYKVENGISIPYVYYVNIADNTYNRVNVANGQTFHGANWGGEVEVLQRILNTVKIKQGDHWIDLPDNPLTFNFMPLQDAIDFAVYAVRTTIETIRFQQKAKTVGGPIDVIVIRPNEAPQWIKRKELKFE